jgi:hypothetical protein
MLHKTMPSHRLCQKTKEPIRRGFPTQIVDKPSALRNRFAPLQKPNDLRLLQVMRKQGAQHYINGLCIDERIASNPLNRGRSWGEFSRSARSVRIQVDARKLHPNAAALSPSLHAAQHVAATRTDVDNP